MIKVEIDIPANYGPRSSRITAGGSVIPVEQYIEFMQEVSEWMTQTFGADRGKGPNNTRTRRAWSVKYHLYKHKVIVMCRHTDMALITRLRWC